MFSYRVAAAALALSLRLGAQSGVLLTAQFHTPRTYASALESLDTYYQEQVGRKLDRAFPKLDNNIHYEIWHDMWVFFAPDANGAQVTIKCQTDPATILLARGWMLQLSSRIAAETPLQFKEEPALREVSSEIYASRRDVASAFAARASFKLLPTWRHAGLLVSAAPLARVILASAGLHGVHNVTAAAETPLAARQLMATVTTSITRPCICAAYSELAELDQDIREKASDTNATTAQRVYLAQIDPKTIEASLRAEPATQKKLADTAGWYAVKFRIDKPFTRVQIRWSELVHYSRENGSFESERPLGESSVANPRMPPEPGAQLTGRTRLQPIQPGAYRILLEGQTATGGKIPIDQRDYWFDGKTFEEL
jgi:hypothetical protein